MGLLRVELESIDKKALILIIGLQKQFKNSNTTQVLYIMPNITISRKTKAKDENSIVHNNYSCIKIF